MTLRGFSPSLAWKGFVFFLAWSGHEQQLSILAWLLCLVTPTRGAFPDAAPETLPSLCVEQRSGVALGIHFPVPPSTGHNPWGRNPCVPTLAAPKGSRGVPVLITACACDSTLLQAQFSPPQKNTNATKQMSPSPEERFQHRQPAWFSSL